MSSPDAPIGGFFEAHEAGEDAPGPRLIEAWTSGRPWAAFQNARAAFAALAAHNARATVWLPAFLCRSLLSPGLAGRVRFYPVREGFEPDLAAVEGQIASGDLVLAVAYFGMALAEPVRSFARRRPDVVLVEDRAQALDAGPAAPGAWLLYSPRKLLGVADGGLLVAPSASDEAPPQPTLPAGDEAALWRPLVMRRDDPLGLDNAAWHEANQIKEAAMDGEPRAMSAASLDVLARTSLAALVGPRLSNWRALDAELGRWSALPPGPAAPPLGYVLQLEPSAREAVRRALHARRIFAAVHWPEIAAPSVDFPREEAWTGALLTLPCDHRYGEAGMARIAAVVREALG